MCVCVYGEGGEGEVSCEFELDSCCPDTEQLATPDPVY